MSAGIYKTPGVYVEEIPKFPPSIAPVATAIPAFIGYTERATKNGESLHLKPLPIESIAEFELYFGGQPSQDVEIYLDTNDNYVRGEATSKLFLYDSLRMFYANGGGKCYIISVGLFPASINDVDIDKGIEALAEEDEPTIILLPDAVTNSKLYDLQKKALIQCNKLQDRVIICDLASVSATKDFNTTVVEFRNGIGINHLKYGAGYGPWLKTNLPRQIWRRNVKFKRDGTNTDVKIEDLTSSQELKNLIRDIKFAEEKSKKIKDNTKTLNSNQEGKTLDDGLKVLLSNYNNAASTVAALEPALQALTDFIFETLSCIKKIRDDSYAANTEFKIKDSIDGALQSGILKEAIKKLAGHHNTLKAVAAPDSISIVNEAAANLDDSAKLLGYANTAALLADSSDVSASYPASVNTNKKRSDVARDGIYEAAINAIATSNFTAESVYNFEKTLNESLLNSFGVFKSLTIKAAEALNLLPPSGAIAGVYAATDRDRGVWKAPANVSLNAVVEPAVKISHEQQADYNVDANAGKSINIIRGFTGKGTLVWGARTLAGNDNEWRYVSVRRFFNFVEESVKKATEQFVFESNDANTWVKVQAMIENFLNTQWRQGALQGIKPEHAFYVAVGLGKTMTPLDILEGRLIVEIGMAVVRPAEFIVLRFSHKMAES